MRKHPLWERVKRSQPSTTFVAPRTENFLGGMRGLEDVVRDLSSLPGTSEGSPFSEVVHAVRKAETVFDQFTEFLDIGYDNEWCMARCRELFEYINEVDGNVHRLRKSLALQLVTVERKLMQTESLSDSEGRRRVLDLICGEFDDVTSYMNNRSLRLGRKETRIVSAYQEKVRVHSTILQSIDTLMGVYQVQEPSKKSFTNLSKQVKQLMKRVRRDCNTYNYKEGVIQLQQLNCEVAHALRRPEQVGDEGVKLKKWYKEVSRDVNILTPAELYAGSKIEPKSIAFSLYHRARLDAYILQCKHYAEECKNTLAALLDRAMSDFERIQLNPQRQVDDNISRLEEIQAVLSEVGNSALADEVNALYCGLQEQREEIGALREKEELARKEGIAILQLNQDIEEYGISAPIIQTLHRYQHHSEYSSCVRNVVSHVDSLAEDAQTIADLMYANSLYVLIHGLKDMTSRMRGVDARVVALRDAEQENQTIQALQESLATTQARAEEYKGQRVPQLITLDPFTISKYLQLAGYTPKDSTVQQMYTVLGKDITWEERLEELQTLVQQVPLVRSSADGAFLHDVSFALRESRRVGTFKYKIDKEPAFSAAVESTIVALEEYAQEHFV